MSSLKMTMFVPGSQARGENEPCQSRACHRRRTDFLAYLSTNYTLTHFSFTSRPLKDK